MELLKWLRYLSYIPPRKIIGKVVHAVHGRLIARFPNRMITPWAVESLFSDDSLHAFAMSYQSMGDRFTDAALIHGGVFSVKGVSKDFGSIDDFCWNNAFVDEPEKLHWMHDLAFFSYAIALVRQDPVSGLSAIGRLIQALERHHKIGGGRMHFAWSPIALSLRIMGISTAMSLVRKSNQFARDPDLNSIARHVAYCAGLLDSTAERYLGYNHNAFAATALAVAASATGRLSARNKYADQAAEAICKHVLDDGFWEERSPTYHIHMLLLAQSLLAMNCIEEQWTMRLMETQTRMLRALGTVVHADGEIALFNDAAIDDAVPPAAVGWTPPTLHMSSSMLPQSGYAQLRSGRTSVVFDAGIMGPDDVIGHGHGDFLSVEVCWNGRRLFVDPGVGSITGGEKRQRTRSAAFHNGPGYEGLEPAEFFGTWRVGRRGTASFVSSAIRTVNGAMEVEGWSDGYSRFTSGQRLQRHVVLDQLGAICIRDVWPTTAATLERRLAFLVPSEWSIGERSAETLSLHLDDLRVNIAISNGRLKEIADTTWHPYGPLAPRDAHLITFEVFESAVESTIRLT